ncbi:MAG: HAMP domain-containing sensor histidine kinase [Rhodoferax sp.]
MSAAPGRPEQARDKASGRWHRRARHALGHSIKLRLLLVFLVLALATVLAFVSGAQRAFSLGWREAARPLVRDYVDRLAQDISPDGTPDVARAQALAQRLPLTIRIEGTQVRWQSHPQAGDAARWAARRRDDARDWPGLLERTTSDGHLVSFGIDGQAFERQTHLVGFTLTLLLVITLLAFLYLRHLLRPLDAISAGARRFGAGDFSQPIPVRRPQRPDELGQLAGTINTMGQDIRQMLDAKRALLLAISHELRSPLTRARLNTELLPEDPAVQPQRDALLRDLQEMAGLITDLLESERLASPHAALLREPVALPALAQDVLAELQAHYPQTTAPLLHAAPDLPVLPLDPSRMRLLLRNLLDNALRHGGDAAHPPELHLDTDDHGGLRITVRDHGPGVPEEQLAQLAEPFFRPDSARTRAQGGVGLGLYLCRLVAQAHGGTFKVSNAQPGLRVEIGIPGQRTP